MRPAATIPHSVLLPNQAPYPYHHPVAATLSQALRPTQPLSLPLPPPQPLPSPPAQPFPPPPLLWVPQAPPTSERFLFLAKSFAREIEGGAGGTRGHTAIHQRSYRVGILFPSEKPLMFSTREMGRGLSLEPGWRDVTLQETPTVSANVPKQAQPAVFLCWDGKGMESYQ